MMTWNTSPEAFDLTSAPIATYKGMSNTQALGNLLYTHYALVFQGAGLILLIAMIGAIVLTLRHREGVRKQKLGDQIGTPSQRECPTYGYSKWIRDLGWGLRIYFLDCFGTRALAMTSSPNVLRGPKGRGDPDLGKIMTITLITISLLQPFCLPLEGWGSFSIAGM